MAGDKGSSATARSLVVGRGVGIYEIDRNLRHGELQHFGYDLAEDSASPRPRIGSARDDIGAAVAINDHYRARLSCPRWPLRQGDAYAVVLVRFRFSPPAHFDGGGHGFFYIDSLPRLACRRQVSIFERVHPPKLERIELQLGRDHVHK